MSEARKTRNLMNLNEAYFNLQNDRKITLFFD